MYTVLAEDNVILYSIPLCTFHSIPSYILTRISIHINEICADNCEVFSLRMNSLAILKLRSIPRQNYYSSFKIIKKDTEPL